jgi:putative peptidoglycan lipid II flippase
MCGLMQHVQFWQGTDITTRQLVGLSLIDVEGVLPVERVDEVLSRTVRLDVCGVARILNVMHTGEFGVVATQWVPGGTLREGSLTPRPLRRRSRRRWNH